MRDTSTVFPLASLTLGPMVGTSCVVKRMHDRQIAIVAEPVDGPGRRRSLRPRRMSRIRGQSSIRSVRFPPVVCRLANIRPYCRHTLRNPWKAFAPQLAPVTGTGVRAYGLAVAATLVSVAVTRFTWPLFAGTPFVPLFGAVVVATHWGTGPAGLVTIVLTLFGATLAFPPGGPSVWEPRTLAVFFMVSLLANRIVAGRNRAAAALRATEGQLRATWEHAALGVALLNRRGEIERINPALERLLGHSPTTCVGMAFWTFSHPDEAAAERQRFVELIGGADAFYQREHHYRRQDETQFWGRVTVSVIRGPDAVPTGALAILEDVSAHRQAELDLRASEQQLRRAQKMEAVGQLVAGVAHNFNNLLTVTMGYTDLLLDRHQGQDLKDLQEIRKATERGAALTRQLLAFGRKHDARLARIDLNATMAGLREMLTRVIREDIQLTIDVPAGPTAVLIDPHDLEQVILNLVINARDALPMGGAVRVDVARETIDATNSPPDLAVTSGEYVRLRVRDNGTGMTPDVQARLFEPFFTTKEVGQGTGLGLAFVHGIARHARGFVTVDTAPGRGTTFSVYLPPAPESVSASAAAPPVSSTEHVSTGATILLVEDEEAVRTTTAQMLTHAGYRVVSAATPREACALFAQHAANIDLLMSDVVMPEMHGPALAQRLIAQRPDLRVLFVSGYSDALPASGTQAGKAAFLAKPFPASGLVTAVAALLGTRTR
jgi:PAS domain S-box-containing protein